MRLLCHDLPHSSLLATTLYHCNIINLTNTRRLRNMSLNAASSRKEEKRRQAAMSEPVDLASPDCELMAIRQFTCTYVPYVSIDCKPLQRLFMLFVRFFIELIRAPILIMLVFPLHCEIQLRRKVFRSHTICKARSGHWRAHTAIRHQVKCRQALA